MVMTLNMRLRTLLATACVLAACVLAACGLAEPEPSSVTPGPAATAGELARPLVAQNDPDRPRYIRDEWQPRGWADVDGDSCNTREEVLISESTVPAQLGPGCKVLAGEWQDRYTGRRLTSPADVQIDHLVSATSTAWPQLGRRSTRDRHAADEQASAEGGGARWS